MVEFVIKVLRAVATVDNSHDIVVNITEGHEIAPVQEHDDHTIAVLQDSRARKPIRQQRSRWRRSNMGGVACTNSVSMLGPKNN